MALNHRYQVPWQERFWPRVVKLDVAPFCWVWSGSVDTKGYGQADVGGRRQMVHRLAYEALVEPVPAGLQLDHLCRNKRCVNPVHLEPVTLQENMRRARRTHCKRGHLLVPGNLRTYGAERQCLVCLRAVKNAWTRRARARAKAVSR